VIFGIYSLPNKSRIEIGRKCLIENTRRNPANGPGTRPFRICRRRPTSRSPSREFIRRGIAQGLTPTAAIHPSDHQMKKGSKELDLSLPPS
jgi:hypothetical protein